LAIESAVKEARRVAAAEDAQPLSSPSSEHTLRVAMPIDAYADGALSAQRYAAGTVELRCDVCDALIEGEPSGRGLYMWTRGDEIRFEEPALCPGCATAIGVTALAAWNVEEEEG
jgi:hypothetical protein